MGEGGKHLLRRLGFIGESEAYLSNGVVQKEWGIMGRTTERRRMM